MRVASTASAKLHEKKVVFGEYVTSFLGAAVQISPAFVVKTIELWGNS